jgi:hypothetical protein
MALTARLSRLCPCVCALVLAVAVLIAPAHGQGTVYYVAPGGSDDSGSGSQANPWATISYAVQNVPDGSTILVQPGDYSGVVRLDRVFAQGIAVRSTVPYQARLRNNATVVRSYYGKGITLEGFDIAHSGAGSGALVIQIQDLLGPEPGGTDYVSRITLRNNILHDSYNNDILKINNGAGQITVEGNIFYNQTGSDEHMDVNSVTDVVIQDNIFLNDFAGSGRANGNDTSAFIVIKDSNGTDDTNLGSARVTVRRNVFLNWQGSAGYGFVQVGEDATSNYEAREVAIENNLMLGNSATLMRSPIGIMGSRDVTVRNNTVAGDFPSNSFALRLYQVGENQPNLNLRFYNNIWSDPTGTMQDFSDSAPGQTSSFELDRNLYWNGGQPLPNGVDDLVNPNGDARRVVGDPRLGSQAGLVVPRWVQSAGQFADGSASIRAAFERLVALYGAPGAGSAALGAADPTRAPTDDILGNPRGALPSLGAFEAEFGVSVTPAALAIAPGGVATFTVTVAGAAGDPITLSTSPAPSLTLQLTPQSLVSPGQATLRVTSLHAGPQLLPGRWYSLPITATGPSGVRSTQARLLVGGVRVYLPTVRR